MRKGPWVRVRLTTLLFFRDLGPANISGLSGSIPASLCLKNKDSQPKWGLVSTCINLHVRQTITEGTQVFWKESVHCLWTTLIFFSESFDELGRKSVFEMCHSCLYWFSLVCISEFWYTNFSFTCVRCTHLIKSYCSVTAVEYISSKHVGSWESTSSIGRAVRAVFQCYSDRDHTQPSGILLYGNNRGVPPLHARTGFLPSVANISMAHISPFPLTVLTILGLRVFSFSRNIAPSLAEFSVIFSSCRTWWEKKVLIKIYWTIQPDLCLLYMQAKKQAVKWPIQEEWTFTVTKPHFTKRECKICPPCLSICRSTATAVTILTYPGLDHVHTWCPSTSAWALAQNGAVFRHWVPKI